MMGALLFLLLGIVLPMMVAYRIAPTRGRPRLGFMLLGWLGVIILLCMKPDPAAAAASATKAAAPRVYTPSDYRRVR